MYHMTPGYGTRNASPGGLNWSALLLGHEDFTSWQGTSSQVLEAAMQVARPMLLMF